ncbi:hypothetical protein RCL1_001113 [Eukaryota sp. TZLM3-RCL]
MGFRDSILKDLDIYITTIEYELFLVLKLEIEKPLKFFLSKKCYSGKVTHLVRCLGPTLSYDFCRSLNKLRTNFLASLLEVDPLVLKSHIFCSSDLGGLGFASSKYLSAFLGDAKNFVFGFSKRYGNRLSLLSQTDSEYLIAVRNEISNLPPKICFSSDLTDIPSHDVSSLAGAYIKLQNRLVRFYEDMDSTVRITLAKYGNPSFGNFLMDVKNSSASVLFTQTPQVYGLLLNDHQWTTSMRLRCFLWPNNLPHDLVCKCSKLLTFHHWLNCKYFIT